MAGAAWFSSFSSLGREGRGSREWDGGQGCDSHLPSPPALWAAADLQEPPSSWAKEDVRLAGHHFPSDPPKIGRPDPRPSARGL
jgi:hypothetical protein